jgi:hypothetical protein
MTKNIYLSNKLNSYSFIKHAFFTRNGGVSIGSANNDFASLNVGLQTGDDINLVLQNRQIVANYFNQTYTNLLTLKQSHTNKVFIVKAEDTFDTIKNIEADALITKEKNKILSVVHADCCPILILDTKNKIIASIHSGWRGAFLGVINNTLDEMKKLAKESPNYIATIGPTISQDSYEVDEIFYNQFIEQKSTNNVYFVKKLNNKFLFNLPLFVKDNLILSGVNSINIQDLNLDTYGSKGEFFSHRRATHKDFRSRGLQVSAIMLNSL